MFCIFQCVIICSMFDPLMITNLLMRLSLLILNTKHYGIKISKFYIINFLSTTNEILWQLYSFGYLQNKDGYGISLWKETENFASMCGNKNREAFPSEQYCRLKIYEKFNWYEICNKYNENTFAIYINFLHFHYILWFIICSNNPAHMYSLLSRAFCNLIRSIGIN